MSLGITRFAPLRMHPQPGRCPQWAFPLPRTGRQSSDLSIGRTHRSNTKEKCAYPATNSSHVLSEIRKMCVVINDNLKLVLQKAKPKIVRGRGRRDQTRCHRSILPGNDDFLASRGASQQVGKMKLCLMYADCHDDQLYHGSRSATPPCRRISRFVRRSAANILVLGRSSLWPRA